MTRSTLLFATLVMMAARAGGDPIVLHAEPPAQHPLAHVIAITARVEVRVQPDGSVSEANALGRPPFVTALSEKAACQWRFSPSPENSERSYVLRFVYAGVSTTDEPSHWEVTREDDLSLRVRYLQTTVRRLERDEHGQVADERCPRHRVPMDIGMVPIAYGLPRSYSSTSAESRNASRVWRARRRLFPEANLWAGGGGCTVQPEKTAEVHFCAICRRERAEWFRSHPGFEQYE
jgi:hypothetical protein